MLLRKATFRPMQPYEADHTIHPMGTRVRLRFTLLQAHERAPSIPRETAATPYTVRVNGILQHPSCIGAEAMVLTASGRQVSGVVEEIGPADRHTFGRPPSALVRAIEALHALARTLT